MGSVPSGAVDLTPSTLRQVEFREKLRGYHPADVDAFLEGVAVAVGDLLARLQAAEAADPAGETAREIVAAAHEEARRIVVQAQVEAGAAIERAREASASAAELQLQLVGLAEQLSGLAPTVGAGPVSARIVP